MYMMYQIVGIAVVCFVLAVVLAVLFGVFGA
jgi:hypothetical protein